MTLGGNIQNTLREFVCFCMLQFLCRFAVLSTYLSFKPTIKNNTNFENYKSHCLSTWRHSVKKTKFWSKVCMNVKVQRSEVYNSFWLKVGRRTASTGCWWSSESLEQCDE